MTKIGLYVSNMTDKLITPGKYFTAEEYHKRRLEAVSPYLFETLCKAMYCEGYLNI